MTNNKKIEEKEESLRRTKILEAKISDYYFVFVLISPLKELRHEYISAFEKATTQEHA